MTGSYRVVLVFDLEPGTADEELRRSGEPESFPRRLAAQPGFLSMDLVRVTDDRTMSVQTWASAEAWWTALDVVKRSLESEPARDDRDDILVSRQFFAGPVAHTLASS